MGNITEKLVTMNERTNYKMMIERYNNAGQMVDELRARPITDDSFEDKSKRSSYGSWEGVKTYEECLGYLNNGYQPVVDALKDAVKPTINGTGKRIGFKTDIVGCAPIVPLAIMNVPMNMTNQYIKPIKAKVIDVYYDVTCSSGTDSEDIIDAGQKVLAEILRLEQCGYKFNLYAVQTYSDSEGCDMLVVKIKSSNQPLDLKRMSYALTHTSFFRVLGFDWYSRTPKGTYRSCYGRNLASNFDYDQQRLEKFTKQLFGNNAVYISAMIMQKKTKQNRGTYINAVLGSADKNIATDSKPNVGLKRIN